MVLEKSYSPNSETLNLVSNHVCTQTNPENAVLLLCLSLSQIWALNTHLEYRRSLLAIYLTAANTESKFTFSDCLTINWLSLPEFQMVFSRPRPHPSSGGQGREDGWHFRLWMKRTTSQFWPYLSRNNKRWNCPGQGRGVLIIFLYKSLKARVHLKPVFPPFNLGSIHKYLVRVSSNPTTLCSFHKKKKSLAVFSVSFGVILGDVWEGLVKFGEIRNI